MAAPDRQPVRTETEVSGGSKEGVVRYVLVIGLILALIAMIGAYLFF